MKINKVSLLVVLTGIFTFVIACSDEENNTSEFDYKLEQTAVYTRMYEMTMQFCFKKDSADCNLMPPLKLTLANGIDCEIVKGNMTSVYENSENFEIIQPAVCKQVSRQIIGYSTRQEVEMNFNKPDVIFSTDTN